MAKHLTYYFKAIEPINPDNILFASGVTSLCNMLGLSLFDPGDAILLTSPIYQAFKSDFGVVPKVRPIFVDFAELDMFSPQGVAKYEEAIQKAELEGVRVRALLLCNPHNPLGQCYPKDVIIAIMKLCNKYKIHLICDEIYGASVYTVGDKAAEPFTSSLSFDHSAYIDKDLVHVLYGMSKDFGTGGLRLGCVIMRNDELMRAMSALSAFSWSGGVNEHIATQILQNEEWLDNFLDLARERLSTRNKLVRQMLDDVGIDYHRGANAGFFMWIDLRKFLPPRGDLKDEWDRERILAGKMIENKVFITNGEELSAPEPGYFRVIFSQDERTIVEGLKRVFATVGV